jgi:NAD(P)-dependent dehydrogenase (short-subunit alcohol dehydrogenase family)
LDSGKLSGKVCVVTGAGSGIGRAIAVRFGRGGAKVIVGGPHLDTVKQTAKIIEDDGGEACALLLDVSRSEQVRDFTSKTLQTYGCIDILVNNAGIFTMSPIEDLSEQDWDRVMDVNLKGPFLCSKAIGQHMISRKSGVILNVNSISAQIPEPYLGAYTPSKAGLLGLTAILALEWAKYGIRVVGISPGPIRTPMHEREYSEEKLREARHQAVPLGRPGEPEEIASLAEFLVSDDAGFITGETVIADGGSSISMFHTIRLLKEYAAKNRTGR